MDKTNTWLLGILLFLLGAGIVLMYHLANPVVQEKQVLVKDIQYVNLTNTVEKIVSVDSNNETYADAFSEFESEISDNRSLKICDGDRYDFDQITYSVDDKSIAVDDSNRRDTLTTVTFTADTKYSDKDVESKCYRDLDVEVVFHSNQNKDTEITVA